MIDSPFELIRLLRGHGLGDRAVVALPIAPGTQAFAVQADADRVHEDWRVLRSLVATTGRWPVLVSSHTDSHWRDAFRENDPFDRFEYGHEPWRPKGADIMPASIVARATALDGERVLLRWRAQQDEGSADLTAMIEAMRRSGMPMRSLELEQPSPDAPAARKARFLADHAEGAAAPPDPDYQDWYDGGGAHLAFLLLPGTEGWTAPAYVHWFGAGATDSAATCAVLRHWQQRFGAELVAHLGTILQFVVAEPPTDAATAFDLAWDHSVVAPDTLAPIGVEVEEHAALLIGRDRWQLHSRP